jgi:folate-binding protein YgfZ
MRERLERFKLRIKCELEPVPWRCLAIRGPKAHALAEGTDADWPGLPGVDQVGDDIGVPPGVRECDLGAYEAVRIEAGVPVMGRELDESTIPAEAGVVDRAVSFTKGCFTGQELVARIDSRGGNVPRHLRGIVIGTNVVPPVGARVEADGKEVGALTSVAESLERRAPVALAYVRRAVEPPADVTVSWDGGSVQARVETLPLVA